VIAIWSAAVPMIASTWTRSESWSCQLEHRLIADDRHPRPIERGAVRDDVGRDVAVREAALPEAEVEGEPQRVSRLERPAEREDPVPDLLVHEHGFGEPVESDRARLDVGIEIHVHRIDRRARPVHEAVASAHVDFALARVDLDPELRAL
jgi:hypothetical protein